jgi:hypothetical protein
MHPTQTATNRRITSADFRKIATLSALALTLSLTACGEITPPIAGCIAKDGLTPICGFSNPEDLELLPDGHTLLVSQMSRDITKGEAGSLVFFDTRSGVRTPAWHPASDTDQTTEKSWGDANCPGSPGAAIAPHGTSFKKRNDGRWQVAVVNHGGRESIEMFELISAKNTAHKLVWRGCVIPESGIYLNDVALLRDGSFVASHMFDKNATHIGPFSLPLLRAMAGADTGHVFEWRRGENGDTGFRTLEGSIGAFPNGVELSPDEGTVYANMYFNNEMRKIDRSSGALISKLSVDKPDNLSWDTQGRLLVLSHTGTLRDELACFGKPGETCPLAFAVVRVDTQAMSSEIVLQHEGAPMGAATVARQVGAHVYLGTFSGDRMVRLDY